jgi:hypothetical protein
VGLVMGRCAFYRVSWGDWGGSGLGRAVGGAGSVRASAQAGRRGSRQRQGFPRAQPFTQ